VVHQVTLKSSEKYGYDESAYNLSGHCFSRKGKRCEVSDQLMFNHGGDKKSLHLQGHFIVLDSRSAEEFNEISLEKLSELALITTDGTPVTRDTIFGNPSTTRKLAIGESSIDREYSAGTVALALVDGLWSNGKYQLFKLRIEDVTPGEEVSISYQRIAEAPTADLRNFFCTRQAQIRSDGTLRSEGEAVIYGRDYAGYESSTFGFEYGVNGFDGRFVRSNSVMSFAHPQKCSQDQASLCVTPYVGWVAGYWGGVIDLGDQDLAQVDRSVWSNLQGIHPRTASMELKENRTYAISQLTDSEYTFGAIRITEMDRQGRWVKFNWKRVAIEKPYRFITYTKLPISGSAAYGEVTLGKKWWDETHLDVASGKRADAQYPSAEPVYFDVSDGTLRIDNRYFPSHSGIVEVTRRYKTVEDAPEGAAENFVGQYQRSAPIKVGSVYVVSSETLWNKVSIAVQVVDYIPNQSVTLRFKRLYNGQTFPGSWDK
jgi:hypothetical protein